MDGLAGLAAEADEDVRRHVGVLREAGQSAIELSPDGDALFGRWRDTVARVTAEIYAPFDRTDLAITRRVLVELTERTNAWLAAAHASNAA